MKIKKLFEEYKKLSAITETIEDDEAWDKAYREEFDAYTKLCEEVARLTGVDAPTSRAIVCNDKFESLISRLA